MRNEDMENGHKAGAVFIQKDGSGSHASSVNNSCGASKMVEQRTGVNSKEGGKRRGQLSSPKV